MSNNIFLWGIIAFSLLLIFWVITIYNKLVSTRQMVKEGWSGIDVQLKRRISLIPNLVEAVKGYMSHEKSALEQVTQLRSKCQQTTDIAERAQAESMLSAALGKLIAISENYPDLKASSNFLELQKTLDEIESEIQLARRYYNGSARNLNIMVESFPSNLIAKNFAFQKAQYFELENESERATPQVKF